MVQAYILGSIAVIIFGATLPVTSIALVDFSPWFVTFGRALIASVPAIILLLAWGKPLRNSRNFAIFLAGLFLVFGFPGFMSLGLQSVPAGNGGVVLGILPLLTAVFASLYANERQTTAFWWLCIAGAIIVSIFVIFKGGFDGGGTIIGYIWLLLAGVSAAIGYVLFGKISREISGIEVICRALMLNMPITSLGTWLFWQPSFVDASAASFAALIYLGVFSMLLGFFAWNKALALGGIGKIGQVQLLQVFVTLVTAAILLGEAIDLVTIVAALVITGIVFLSKNQ